MDHVLEKRKKREKRSLLAILQFIFIEKKVFLFIIALLLGRAVILFNISPFALAFLATLCSTHQKRMFVLAALVCIGAFTHSLEQASFIFLSITIFYLFTRFFNIFYLFTHFIKNRSHLKFFMLFVFLSYILTRIFLISIMNQITPFEWVHLVIEGVLTVMLLLIFMQSIPLISHKRYQPALKNEEIICLLILFASVLTGL